MECNEFMMRVSQVPFEPQISALVRGMTYENCIAAPSFSCCPAGTAPTDLLNFIDPRNHCIDFAGGSRFIVWHDPSRRSFRARWVVLPGSPLAPLFIPDNLHWLKSVGAAALSELSTYRHVWAALDPKSFEPLEFAALSFHERKEADKPKAEQLAGFWAKRLQRGLDALKENPNETPNQD